MSASPTLLTSTIGRKVVMATTGVILFAFVVAHMAGNLQLYLGPGPMNAYAVFLRELLHGSALWIVRGVLLASVIFHIWAAASLTRDDLAARPVGYREWQARRATYASRSMRWTGVFLALFVVYHLLDFTFGTANPHYEPGNVYGNVVASFRVPAIALFYVVAMAILGLHLKHGTMSMLRTLGLSHPRHELVADRILTAIVVLTIAANVSFPLAVLTGVVG
jgi:succinate dehydrogenase cytochrome b subunit